MTLTASEVASLSTSLRCWESAEYLFAGLVTLACAGEYIANFSNWLTRGIDEKKKRLEKRSTLLLVVSLLLELICMMKTNQISGRIIGSLAENAEQARERSERAIINADSAIGKAQRANEESENAESFAGNAMVLASKARVQAVDAEKRSRGVEKQAGNLKKQADGLASALGEQLKETTEITQSLSPRIIRYQMGPGDFSTFQELKPFAGTKVIFEVLTDVEARRAASEIAKILNFAQWKISDPVPNPDLWTGYNDGVHIEYEMARGLPFTRFPPSKDEKGKYESLERCQKAAQALESYLIGVDWDAWSRPDIENRIPANTLKIVVGFKPNPLFEPDWIKNGKEEHKRMMKELQELEKRLPSPSPPK